MSANKLEAGKSDNLTNRGRGRPAGSVNKATKTFRDTVNALLESNSENVATWLQQVADGIPEVMDADGKVATKGIPAAPEKALDLLAKLAEYAAPKLARTEITGPDGGPMQLQQVRRVIVDPK